MVQNYNLLGGTQSENETRIQQNLDLFQFSLNAEDMAAVDTLGKMMIIYIQGCLVFPPAHR